MAAPVKGAAAAAAVDDYEYMSGFGEAFLDSCRENPSFACVCARSGFAGAGALL